MSGTVLKTVHPNGGGCRIREFGKSTFPMLIMSMSLNL